MLIRKTPSGTTKRRLTDDEGEASPPKIARTTSEGGESSTSVSVVPGGGDEGGEGGAATIRKLNPFDKKHQNRITVVSGKKKPSTAVYKKCRFDGNGVMSIEPVTIESKDKATQYGKATFDALVLRKYKLGENELQRIDAKGKLQTRFAFFLRMVLMPDLLYALEKVWASCTQARAPGLETLMDSSPNQYGEHDISGIGENKYSNEICQ